MFPDVAACQENIEGDIKIPDHPLVDEVMKDVLTEAMDVDGLKEILRRMEDGRIRCIAVDTPVPSQFSHEILNANPYAYLDDAPLEERRARAVEMRRVLPESILEEVGKLDEAAIAQVRAEAWPDLRDADELHDVLHTLIALPESSASRPLEPLLSLSLNFRTAQPAARVEDRGYWVAVERAKMFSVSVPGSGIRRRPSPNSRIADCSYDDAVLAYGHGMDDAQRSHLGAAIGRDAGSSRRRHRQSAVEHGSDRRDPARKVYEFPSAVRDHCPPRMV